MKAIKTTMACLVAALAVASPGGARAGDSAGARFRPIHSFTQGEGHAPQEARLARGPDGHLYGTTPIGGPLGGGTVFRMTSKGALTVLHAFVAEQAEFTPSGITWGGDGHFYGVTTYGGSFGGGSFYRITPAGDLTVLSSFELDTKVGNYWPSHGLMLSSDGRFYGAANDAIFRVTPAGEMAVLYSFVDDRQGRRPNGGLIEDEAGDLYGTTASGGEFGHGAVYRLSKAGVLTVLHSFAGHRTDGKTPRSGVTLVGDQLYGTTMQGGKHDQGVVFRLSTHGGNYQLLHAFKEHGRAPCWPSTGLTLAPDGWLYGASERGGTAGSGTIYRVSPTGQVTPLHSFGQSADVGLRPRSDLLLSGERTFHGTTDGGGMDDLGTVYKLTLKP